MVDLWTRAVRPEDEPMLWEMLYLASHSDEDEGATVESIKTDPALARYVAGWGRPGDVGVVTMLGSTAVGAAWVRLLVGDERTAPAFVADDVPELAIGVTPRFQGKGFGKALMKTLLAQLRAADPKVPAVTLNVREENLAVHLYRELGFEVIDLMDNRVGTTSLKMLLRLHD
jgi:ribosomal protein S18 acetylase RimI-like enzyme